MASGVLINPNDANKSSASLNNYNKTVKKTTAETANLNKTLSEYVESSKRADAATRAFTLSRYKEKPLDSDFDFFKKQTSSLAGKFGGAYGKGGAAFADFQFALSSHGNEKNRAKTIRWIETEDELKNKENRNLGDESSILALRSSVADKLTLDIGPAIKKRDADAKAYKIASTPQVFPGEGINGSDLVIEPNPALVNIRKATLASSQSEVDKLLSARQMYSGGFNRNEFLSEISSISNLLNSENESADSNTVNNFSGTNYLYSEQSGNLTAVSQVPTRSGKQLACQTEDKTVPNRSFQEERNYADEIIYSGLSESDKLTVDYSKKKQKLDEAWSSDPEGNKEGLEYYSRYQQAKTELLRQETEARNALSQQEMARDRQAAMDGLKSMDSAVTGLMGIVENAKGKQSGTYKALFAMSKAFNVAQATLNLQGAIMSALNAPDTLTVPQKFANMAAVAASGVQLLSSITSITMAGQAHAGIDFIPREGTWLLDRGERVVDSRTNADLKQYLRNNTAGSQGGSSVSVNVPLSIQSQDSGNSGVSTDDANILAGLIKSKVYEIVTNEQRPGGLLSRG